MNKKVYLDPLALVQILIVLRATVAILEQAEGVEQVRINDLQNCIWALEEAFKGRED